MANSITSGLENVLGIDTTAGNSQIQAALAALNAVGVPTAQQLDLPTLQKYVSAGVLTPAQYQAIQENPNAYSQAIQQTQSNTGMNAQQAALQQLGGIAQTGSTPINQATLMNNINTTNQANQAAQQGIQEQAQERGVAGGGQEFLNQLLAQQQNNQNSYLGGVNAASNNAQLALQALANEGTLGGQVQSEAQQSAQAQAQAAQQIQQYNSQLQSAANQYNTQNANQAQQMNLANAQQISGANTGLANQQTEYNAQIPQEIYQDTLGKAQAIGGEENNAAQLAEQQAQSQNQFTGGLLGAGATLGGDYMLGSALGGAGTAAAAGGLGSSAASIGNGYSTPTGANANPSNYGIDTGGSAAQGPTLNLNNQQPMYAFGGETNPKKETLKAMENNPTAGFCQGGMCYAKGGEVHSHEICMKMGGKVPGKANVPGDSTKNDTVPARLSPHEIVLPRTVAQAPNAPQAAAKFVQGVKQNGGNPPPQTPMGNGKSFADIIKELEANGLELRIGSK
jgi:hypothetical protein